MHYLFILFVLLTTGIPAHAQVRPYYPQQIGTDELLAECRLFLKRPDLRTATFREFLDHALQERESAWAKTNGVNDAVGELTKKRAEIVAICTHALAGDAAAPREPPGASLPPNQTRMASHRRASKFWGYDRKVESSAHQIPLIEPWPPPIPTDQATYAIDHTKLKTVGQFADAVLQRLNDAGIRHVRFWGAPKGVAVVAPLEPIDQNARPLKTNGSGSGRQTEKGGPHSAIFDGFRRLLSEPIRDSRILLFVLTTDSKAKSPVEQMTAEIGRQWTQNGYMQPDIVRSAKLTDQHFVLVEVYEFRKEDEGDPTLLTQDHKRHSLTGHLAASQIDLQGLVK
jgi:hypothetical protein